MALAWQRRLSPRDLALMRAEIGRYPKQDRVGDCLDKWGRATTLAPDQAEPWFWVGDCYYHSGALLGITDAGALAAAALTHANLPAYGALLSQWRFDPRENQLELKVNEACQDWNDGIAYCWLRTEVPATGVDATRCSSASIGPCPRRSV